MPYKKLIMTTLGLMILLVGLTRQTASALSFSISNPAEQLDSFLKNDLPSYETVPLSIPEIPASSQNKKMIEALHLCNTGHYDAALTKVNQVLQTAPNSAPAHELLGAVLVLKGELNAGLAALKKAVQLDPGQGTAFTKIGDVYMAKGQWRKAKVQFLKALAINPDDRRAHQRLGILDDKEGNIKGAIEQYEKGLNGTPPEYIGVKVNLGRLYNRIGKFEKTVNLLGTLLSRQAGDAYGHIVLGTAYLGMKKTDDAIVQFEMARNAARHSTQAKLALAIAYREKGEYGKSLQELKNVTKMRPEWSVGYFQLGETLLRMAKYEKALGAFHKAEKLGADVVLVKIKSAEVYMAQKDFSEAIPIYKEVLASGDGGPKIYDLLGSAYQMNGDFKAAAKVFQQMCEKYPADPYAFYRLGIFYGFIKDYAQSIVQLKKAVALDAQNTSVLHALSVAYRQKGDKAAAIDTVRKILNLNPQDTAEEFYLATLCQDAGRTDEAVKLYQDVITKQPKHALALNNLAYLLAHSDKLGEAIRLAKKAVALDSQNGHVLDTYAWILSMQGKQQTALDELEKSRALSPDDPTTLYHLGLVHYRLGNISAAKKNLEKALNVSHNFEEVDRAKKLLAQVRQQKG